MLRKLLLLVCVSLFLFNCAQQVAPTGGKKDIIPPSLVNSIPSNKSLNYRGTTVQLFFDEYVVLDNITQKLSITPEVDNPYTFKQKGMEVFLKFNKSFKDSTTYTLNFGDSVKDFSEKNPAKNLKLVFSTGTLLDSSNVYGNVKDLQTNKPVFDALVGLYTINDTLNPEKQKPYYFSRTDSSGNFSIENIQNNQYKLIAIDDKNRNLLYNTKEERIAFLDSTINVAGDSIFRQLHLFHSDVTTPRIQRTIPKVNTYSVVFNKNMEKVNVKFSPGDTLPYFHELPNQLKFFKPQDYSADSMLVHIEAVDSLDIAVDLEQKITFMTQRGKTKVVDPFSVRPSVQNGKPLPNYTTNYKLSFTKPVKRFNPSLVEIKRDSVHKEDLSTHKFQWNQSKTILSITDSLYITDTLKITLQPGAVIGIEEDTLAIVKLAYPLLKEEAYGTIKGQIIGLRNGENAIVQLIDNKGEVIHTSFNIHYRFIHIQPGEYTLRVIVDKNGNKRWDTGMYKSKKQPEPIYFLPEKLIVKSNFEYDNINITVK